MKGAVHSHFHSLHRLFGAALLAWSLTGAICARAAEPGPDPAPLAAAKRLFDQGHYPEARAAFEKITVAEPKNAEALFYLGWTAFRLNQPEESVKLLEKATALDATKSLYFHVLGDAYGASAQRASLFSKLGLAKKCLAAYDRGVEVDPNNVEVRTARYHYYFGAPSFIGGGLDKAMNEAVEIQKRDPQQGAVLLVDLYVKEKKNEEAFTLLNRLIEQHPGEQFYRFHLGRLSAITGEHLDRGEAVLRGYLNHLPTGNEPPLWAAHWRLGMIAERKGEKTSARMEYDEALKLNPGSIEARDSRARLK